MVRKLDLGHRMGRTVAALVGATSAAILLIVPAGAQAGPLVASAPDCSDMTTSQPFLPWVDPASYVMVPGGTFEDGASGWRLTGDADVVGGNESYYVHGSDESQSLHLPPGSSATSPVVCVGIEHPDLRIFARNNGSPLSTMRVSVLFEDATGAMRSAPIGNLVDDDGWQPSAQMPLVVNLLPLLPGNYTPVAFRFTPVGSMGNWRIDDTYVDPFHH